MSTHINARKGDIADTVLLPGDPLRAKWIAETFLEQPRCYNEVRGMLGYTGHFGGRRISVQSTGMGIPSSMIYLHELIALYGAKTLIRVGTAGSYQKELGIREVVIAMAASTTSSINEHRFPGSHYAPTADYGLFRKAIAYAEENDIPVKAGNVLTQDLFYGDNYEDFKKWADYGVLCVEMETAGLYTIAAQHKVKALSLLTISNSLVTGQETTATERERSLDNMVKIALHLD